MMTIVKLTNLWLKERKKNAQTDIYLPRAARGM